MNVCVRVRCYWFRVRTYDCHGVSFKCARVRACALLLLKLSYGSPHSPLLFSVLNLVGTGDGTGVGCEVGGGEGCAVGSAEGRGVGGIVGCIVGASEGFT